jgi:hypothetical protein
VRDERVIGEEHEEGYVVALERNGFAGPGSWYMPRIAAVNSHSALFGKQWRGETR